VDDKPDKPAADSPSELKSRALRLLVRREHSRAELERKLSPHAESEEALRNVLDILLSRRQQSDERFAQERARALSRKYGPARIRQDLKARGVSDEVLARLPGEGEAERAKAILERKYREPATTREERAKRARFLQGRGFSRDVIRALLSI
jgi:regulatory protein